MAQRIRDVMTKDPETFPGTTTLADAARVMRDQGIGDVIVADDGSPGGIVTDRDITIRAVAEGRSPEETTLREIASGELKTVSPDDPADTAVKIMRDEALRRLPVVEGDRVVGIVSIGDLATEKDPESALADISTAPPNR